jgi:hypothetical protein
MPAAMPENSTRGSSAFIRMTSCLGMKFLRMETTRILNGSGFIPRNTVQASPTMPGLTSLSGMMVGAVPTDKLGRDCCSVARVTLAGRAPDAFVVGLVVAAGAATARPLNPRTNKEAETGRRFTSRKRREPTSGLSNPN